MKRRIWLVSSVLLLPFCLPGTSGRAESGPTAAPAAPADPVVQFLMSSAGVSRSAAETRARDQALINDKARAVLAAEIGQRYGGMIIRSDGRLVVRVARGPASAAGQVRGVLDALGVAAPVEVVDVAFTKETLIAAATATGVEMGRLNSDLSFTVAPSLVSDRVEITVPPSAVKKVRAGIPARVAGVPVVVIGRVGEPAPATCVAGVWGGCDKPLRGGVQLSNGAYACTGGFVARSNVDSKLYMLTAGHCTALSGKHWLSFYSDGTQKNLGQAHYSNYGQGGDAGSILITSLSTDWGAAKPWVSVYASSHTTNNQSYVIRTVASAPEEGSIICFTGMTSGTRCGGMGIGGIRVNYCDTELPCGHYTQVTGLASSTMCTLPGDSGGPVYAQNKGYGIVSGALTNVSPCRSWFYGLGGTQVSTNTTILTGTP